MVGVIGFGLAGVVPLLIPFLDRGQKRAHTILGYMAEPTV